MQELGLGLYTLAEAARLIGAEKRSIRRWLFGYDYTQPAPGGRQHRHSGPLWASQYAATDLGEPVLGFRDLLELRIVHRFVQCGVPMIVVRRCHDTARDILSSEYPFTVARFATDGETVFHQALEVVDEGEGGATLLNLRTRQYAFREIIKGSLYHGIEYAAQGAIRWFPVDRSRVVMLDPAVQFGHPTLAQSGVPTASLYASYLAEGRNAANVARIFEVPVRQVTTAVRFEERLRQARLKFFFDNNLPPSLARGIAALSQFEPDVTQVVHLRERFSGPTDDTVWLSELAQEGGWNVVSIDRFRKSSAERELIRQQGLTVFVLDPQWSKPYWVQAAQLVQWWAKDS